MKKLSLLLFPALTVAAFFAACSDKDSSSSDKKKEPVTEVNSIYELGLCGEENEGDTVYAKEQDAEYFCDGENWAPVASDDDKSSSSAPHRMACSECKRFLDLHATSSIPFNNIKCVLARRRTNIVLLQCLS